MFRSIAKRSVNTQPLKPPLEWWRNAILIRAQVSTMVVVWIKKVVENIIVIIKKRGNGMFFTDCGGIDALLIQSC